MMIKGHENNIIVLVKQAVNEAIIGTFDQFFAEGLFNSILFMILSEFYSLCSN